MQPKTLKRQVITLTKKEQQSILWDFILEMRVLIEASRNKESFSSERSAVLEYEVNLLERSILNILNLASNCFEKKTIIAFQKILNLLAEFREDMQSHFTSKAATSFFELNRAPELRSTFL